MNKKILIIPVLVIFLAVVAVAAFLLFNKNNSQQAGSNSSAGVAVSSGGVGSSNGSSNENGSSSSSSGNSSGNGQVAFHIHGDSSKPYATNAPRSNEPAVAPSAGGGSSSNSGQNQNSQSQNSQNQNSQNQSDQLSAAIASGILPDQNGNYVQKIDNSGVNQYDVSQYDYSLPQDQFLSAYYPDAQQVISGSTPVDQALNAQDPVVAGTVSAQQQNNTDTVIPTYNSQVDPSQLNISNDNSLGAINSYIQALGSATAPYDIANNPSLMSDIAGGTTNISDLKSKLATTTSILASLQKQQVPSDMLGLQQSYIIMYRDFNNTLGDEIKMLGDKDAAQANADAQNMQNDVNQLSNAIGIVNSNITTAQNYIISKNSQ